MGQLVRHAKVGQVNWQKSGGGPEFAAVKRACQALHMKRVAASCEVPFEAPAFAAWVKNTKKEVLKESSRSVVVAVAVAVGAMIIVIRSIA